MTKKVHLLFSYGTLSDPRIQHELFGRILTGKKGWIKDWGLYLSANGYLFVKPLAGRRVHGSVIQLNDMDLKAADLWEDLDVYDRERCQVFVDDSPVVTAWLYTRRTAQGEPKDGTVIWDCFDADIRSDIKEIRRLLEHSK